MEVLYKKVFFLFLFWGFTMPILGNRETKKGSEETRGDEQNDNSVGSHLFLVLFSLSFFEVLAIVLAPSFSSFSFFVLKKKRNVTILRKGRHLQCPFGYAFLLLAPLLPFGQLLFHNHRCGWTRKCGLGDFNHTIIIIQP